MLYKYLDLLHRATDSLTSLGGSNATWTDCFKTIVGMSPYCAKCGQALDWGKRPINYEIYLQDLTTLMNRYGDDNENCVTCKDCLYDESCVSPFKYDNDTSVYFCDKFTNKNCSNIESKEKTK